MKGMSNQAIYLLYAFVAISLLFLAGCTTNQPSPSTNTTPIQSANLAEQCLVCNNEMCQTDRDCLYINAESADVCKRMGNEMMRDDRLKEGGWAFTKNNIGECIIRVAIRKNDSNICISNGLQLDCIEAVAKNNKNPVACANLLPEKDMAAECYKEYADYIGILTSCNQLETSQGLKRTVCVLENLSISIAQVEAITPQICVIWGNSDLCTATIAYYKKDVPMCDLSGTEKGNCYAAIALEDPSFDLKKCDAVGVDYPACYFSVAKRTNNPAICDEVPSSLKSNCINEIALYSSDIDLCSQIEDMPNAVACVRYILNKRCPTYPELGECNISMSDCDVMRQVFQLSGRSDSNPDQCYYGIAKKNLDVSACSKIGDMNARTECTQLVGHAAD